MLSVFLSLSAILVIVFSILVSVLVKKHRKAHNFYSYYSNPYDVSLGCVTAALVVSLLIFVILFILVFVYVGQVNTETTYDLQIEVIQEENSRLEQQICSSVNSYLEHEQNIFQSLDVSTAIGLVSAYPILKSDALIQSQINTYIDNTTELKQLKLVKAELSRKRWLLTFKV